MRPIRKTLLTAVAALAATAAVLTSGSPPSPAPKPFCSRSREPPRPRSRLRPSRRLCSPTLPGRARRSPPKRTSRRSTRSPQQPQTDAAERLVHGRREEPDHLLSTRTPCRKRVLDGPDHRDSVIDTESRKSGECHDDLHLLLLRLWSPWTSGIIDLEPDHAERRIVNAWVGRAGAPADRASVVPLPSPRYLGCVPPAASTGGGWPPVVGQVRWIYGT